MAAKVHASPIARNLMLMCMGAGLLMLGTQRHKLAMPTIDLWKVDVSKVSLFHETLKLARWTKPQPQATPSPPPKPTVKLVVDLSDRKVYFYEQDKLKNTYAVAIGQEGWETPIGSFTVGQKYQNPSWQHPITREVIPPGNQNPLGKWWIGFHSRKNIAIGFHGTTDEALIGEAVSHGCLRMKNADIESLAKRVELGTPVVVKQ